MRPSAVIPIIFGIGAIVLSFLCLFAGSKTSFLPQFDIITLNTSEVGHNVFNSSTATNNSALSFIIDHIPKNISSEVDSAINSVAKRIGVHDFYSANILTYCEGYYVPGAVPNATVSKSDIHKNFTSCSNRTAFFEFDPRNALQEELNKTGSDINVSQLGWPDAIDDGIKTLHGVQRATFVLYCIAIGTMALAVLFALISVCLSGRISAFFNILITGLAFASIALASALVTALMVKGSNVVNKYGVAVGIAASKGTGFLALTWVATALMVMSLIYWMLECCAGRRNSRRHQEYPKQAY